MGAGEEGTPGRAFNEATDSRAGEGMRGATGFTPNRMRRVSHKESPSAVARV